MIFYLNNVTMDQILSAFPHYFSYCCLILRLIRGFFSKVLECSLWLESKWLWKSYFIFSNHTIISYGRKKKSLLVTSLEKKYKFSLSPNFFLLLIAQIVSQAYLWGLAWGNKGVTACLPRSKHLLISWLQSPSTVILDSKKIKSVTVSPSIWHEVMGFIILVSLKMVNPAMKLKDPCSLGEKLWQTQTS